MANVFPVDYPEPEHALQLETSYRSRFSILFRDERFPLVLSTFFVYHTQSIIASNPNSVDSVINPTDTRLHEDLRRHGRLAVRITLTQNELTFRWPRTVTICDIQNTAKLVFNFERPRVGYGSHSLDSARSGPRPKRRTQG